MNFVKIQNNSRIRFDAILEVRDGPGEDRVTLCLNGGGERWATKEDWRQAKRRAAVKIVPAAPGTFGLDYLILGDDEVHIERQPIIAWATNHFGEIVSVGFRPARNPNLPFAIEFPDGTVRTKDGYTYPSRDVWTQELLLVTRFEEEEAAKQTGSVH